MAGGWGHALNGQTVGWLALTSACIANIFCCAFVKLAAVMIWGWRLVQSSGRFESLCLLHQDPSVVVQKTARNMCSGVCREGRLVANEECLH